MNELNWITGTIILYFACAGLSLYILSRIVKVCKGFKSQKQQKKTATTQDIYEDLVKRVGERKALEFFDELSKEG